MKQQTTGKNCRGCLTYKPLTEFQKVGRGDKLRARCRNCHNITMRPRCKEHYNENKPYYLSKNKKARQQAAQLIQDYKIKNAICADCKLPHPPWRLDFDHLDPETKFKAVSQLCTHSKARIIQEIQKCEIVCANCHRDRTYTRRKKS